MAAKKGQGGRGKKARAKVGPGTAFTEGVAVRVTDDGVVLGRPVADHEPLPLRHTEHRFGAQRVILSDDQAPIPVTALHRG